MALAVGAGTAVISASTHNGVNLALGMSPTLGVNVGELTCESAGPE